MFVGMQTAYILWTWLIEGRPRATISALFMFTCRGILGYLTQLPVPEVKETLFFQYFVSFIGFVYIYVCFILISSIRACDVFLMWMTKML